MRYLKLRKTLRKPHFGKQVRRKRISIAKLRESRKVAPFIQDEEEGGEGDEIQEAEDEPVVNRYSMPTTICVVMLPDVIAKESQFLDMKWDKYHTSLVGGKRSLAESRLILRSFVKFLIRLYMMSLTTMSYNPIPSTYQFLLRFMRDPILIDHFISLADGYPYRPETLKSHLLHLQSGMKWLEQTTDDGRQEDIIDGASKLRTVISHVMKGIKKVIATETRTRDMSEATAVRQGHWPPGGLLQLQRAVDEQILITTNMFAGTRPVLVTDDLLSNFMSLLFATLYTTAPQGRVKAIEELQMHHLVEIEADGFALVTDFKTAESQQHQAVIFSIKARTLLRIYLNKIRPILQPRNYEPRLNDPLFITIQFRPMENAGRLISRFFEKQVSIHITSTDVRGIVESHLADSPDATDAQRAATHFIVGHSALTASKSYIRKNMRKNILLAAVGFGMEETDVALIANPLPLQHASSIDWGREHPDYGSRIGKRARWTMDELNYISVLADEIMEGNGGNPTQTLMADVLKEIKRREECHALFHPMHILNSSRLRGSGFMKRFTK